MEAGLLPGRNDRRKVNLIQIKVTQYFGGFSAVLRIDPLFAAIVTGRYSEVLHLRIGTPWSSAMSTMLRWLSGKGHTESRAR